MFALVLLLTLLPSQDRTGESNRFPKDTQSASDQILQWNELALEAIRKDRTAPPLAARNLAILHAALFDTVNTIDRRYLPYRVDLKAIEPIHVEAAVAACAARVLSELYPGQARTFDRAMQKMLDTIPASRPRTLGIGVGRYVADRLLDWRREVDVEQKVAYRVTNRVGMWRPTPPSFDDALLPAYGQTRRFGVSDKFDPRFVPPPALSSEEMRDDLAEVRRLGGIDSNHRTAEQTLIAEFWNDGPGTSTPAGHWNQIARMVALEQGNSLTENARIFALLNLALADAAILCWECKYRYRLWRPVTAIRQTEPDWSPLLLTLAFPSYTSSHSTFSGAAATILTEIMGKDEVEFTVGSDGVPGAERTYKGFWEAAREAGRSRIYGGLHFECDNREGLALGKRIGEEILATRLVPLLEDATQPNRRFRDEGTVPRPLPRGSEGSTTSAR